MKILKLTAENFMKLVAVEIKPDGNTVLITGKNGAGKSCILDAITAALCGKKAIPQKPIRGEEENAEIRIETESYIIKRTFTKDGGGTLSITNAEGMKAQSPQALLDKIVGEIAFDPGKFIRLGEDEKGRREQREILMKLAGLNFDDIDAELEEIKEQRSSAKARKEAAEHTSTTMASDKFKDLPNAAISVTNLQQKLMFANKHNEDMVVLNSEIQRASINTVAAQEDVAQVERNIATLEKQFEDAKKGFIEAKGAVKTCEHKQEELVKKLEPRIDVDAIQTEINQAHETNRLIENRANYVKALAEVTSAREEFSALGKKMIEVEGKKAKRLAEAKMPVAGLSVDDNGVLFNCIPFSQTNTAKQLEISIAISMALNPKLKVIRMSGNDLDSDSLKAIQKMVKDKDYQVWIEKVSEDETVGIFIEDGSVKK